MFQLPAKSRIMIAANPANKYDEHDMINISIMNKLDWLVWSKSEKAKRNPRKPPEPYIPPEIKEQTKKEHAKSAGLAPKSIEDIKALLSAPRVDV